MRDRKFSSKEKSDAAVHAYFEGALKEDWLEAFKHWTEKIVKCIIAEVIVFTSRICKYRRKY